MSTGTTLKIVSTSSEQTEALAEQLGKKLKGGEVIELVSDLGGGKTTFVRGLARGLGSTDMVSSPTFTIMQIYKAGKLELHHYDFYRLADVGVTSNELAEDLGESHVVTVIEWGKLVEGLLPPERLVIEIKAVSDSGRQLLLHYSPTLSYLLM